MNKRRICCFFTVLVFVFSQLTINLNCNTVQAKATTPGAKSKKNLNDYKYIAKRIKNERQNKTGKIKGAVEDKLNSLGMYDMEIETLNTEQIDILKNVDINKIQVYTGFFFMDESDKTTDSVSKSGSNAEETLSTLDLEEVNKYYEEKGTSEEEILEKEIEKATRPLEDDCNSDCYSGKVDGEISRSTNLKGRSMTYNLSKSTNMLKKTLVVTSYPKNDRIGVVYTACWEKMPDNRNLDFSYIKWTGGLLRQFDDPSYNQVAISHTWTVTESWKCETGKCKAKRSITSNGKKTKFNLVDENCIKKGTYAISPDNIIVCGVDLHNGTSKRTVCPYCYSSQKKRFDYHYKTFTHEAVSMSFYLKEQNQYKFTYFYPYYLHAKYSEDSILSAIIDAVIGFAEGGKLSVIVSTNKIVESVYSFSGGPVPGEGCAFQWK